MHPDHLLNAGQNCFLLLLGGKSQIFGPKLIINNRHIPLLQLKKLNLILTPNISRKILSQELLFNHFLCDCSTNNFQPMTSIFPPKLSFFRQHVCRQIDLMFISSCHSPEDSLNPLQQNLCIFWDIPSLKSKQVVPHEPIQMMLILPSILILVSLHSTILLI